MGRGCSHSVTPNQVIEGKFMNPKKLVKALRNEYGQYNFRVELRLDQYKIYVLDQERSRSSGLTQEQINECRVWY
ncbi:hypothetical protein BDV23DRAFT_155750 [Aspergillus alliaceus]|uniref:Uncharacterized protein n=1 Tax=Petromyces alliaceus TaxID=209559 RepID=A0A5N7C9H7_PETAA|nr:uncharacterized protein BDW43DRAFT_277767 [Aspergillus alliaceus]KAB8232876.1 hypothetical protein BDW43DRAFT_277767 [Aspergillus alliaceus]KAE8390243.1 hypothetical protein BDV23DRAFT_155750 [Aspergillus alliaceus]